MGQRLRAHDDTGDLTRTLPIGNVPAMLATKDSTAQTMLRALSATSNALDAAMTLDVDRNDDDRAFFQAEKTTIDALFDTVEAANRAVTLHDLREEQKAQARIEVGDVILDRGVRRAKKRLTLETNLKTADHVFGEDVAEIVDAERQVEPGLVLQCVGRLQQVADFPGKSDMVADLKGRADRQDANFNGRTATDLTASNLDAALATTIEKSADGLYRLEKRLLERFPREKLYVRAFFLDIGRKKKPSGE